VSAWARLPEVDDELVKIATQYYNCKNLLPVAGSQAAIQALPRLKTGSSSIGMLQTAYAEHAHAWQQAGHDVVIVKPENINNDIDDLDNLLIINPNNPTGQLFTVHELLGWHDRLQQKNGWLIVDEAFMDVTPENSLATYSQLNGLIVLRSLGKFFGLAGARVGFVLAQTSLLNELSDLLGPWTVTGPSRFITSKALVDTHWQTRSRQQLQLQGQRLHDLLLQHGLNPTGGCALFQWVKHTGFAPLAEHFRQQGILVREFKQPGSLRFGLPANNNQWQRLAHALQDVRT
ncbi:MAG: threonine-phosphate decarboxylase, partial [Gammaproteobacteria bacterium]|nr:threonine-phosphate decarboxylase [Gammaproteobacteria bacterium]